MLMPIKVIMVDDHPLVRRGIESAIRLEKTLELTGSAANSAEALQLINEDRPNVALVGFKAAKRTRPGYRQKRAGDIT